MKIHISELFEPDYLKILPDDWWLALSDEDQQRYMEQARKALEEQDGQA